MTIKRKMTGSGITEKPVLSFDDESDKADPEIAAGMERATLHGWLNSVERECFAIMAAEGLPTYHGCYCYDATGAWRELAPPIRGGIANEIWPIARARGHAPDSEVGFAARMLGDVVWLKRARERGDHERAALFAGYLKAKEVERRMKREREPMWQKGVDHVDARSRGGAETRKRDAQDRPISDAARVECYRRFRSMGLNKSDATDQAAQELGLSPASIRNARKAAGASD
jgi:hypothetical protein